uniref:hypothetical protein n=1 Tax=Escherichia coli TaxID=562 RepID=UPI0012FFA23B
REGRKMSSRDLTRFSAARRHAILVCVLEEARATLTDEVIELHGVSLDIENYCTLSSFFIISGFFGNVIFWMLRRSCGDIEHR